MVQVQALWSGRSTSSSPPTNSLLVPSRYSKTQGKSTWGSGEEFLNPSKYTQQPVEIVLVCNAPLILEFADSVDVLGFRSYCNGSPVIHFSM